jgi:hypothetical protein
MLVTGNRINDSKILSSLSFFDLSEDEHKILEVRLRKDISENVFRGKISLENFTRLFSKTGTSMQSISNREVVIIWIEPGKEPTLHVFNDLPLLKSELDSWGGYLLFLSGDSINGNLLKGEDIQGLPGNTLFGIDNNLVELNKILKDMDTPEVRFPYIIQTDKNGNILFTSIGYRIGIGEQILKHAEY